MSYNYFKNNAFLNSGGTQNNVAYKSLDAIKSSGVSDLSAPSPPMQYDIDYEAVNTLFDTYNTSTSMSTVTAGLKNAISGAKVWGTPVYNAAFENLNGVTTAPPGNLQSTGQFEKTLFDSPSSYPIQPSNFPGLTKGCIWFAMSFWVPGSAYGAPDHIGTIYMNFPDLAADGNRGVNSFFWPLMSKRVEAFVVYGNYLDGNGYAPEKPSGYTESYTDPNTYWYLSSEAYTSSDTDGYHSYGINDHKISAQDGVWGFRTGNRINGHDGSQLSSYSGSNKSFGVQNYNSSDGSVDDVYWGEYFKSSTQFWRGVLWTVTT